MELKILGLAFYIQLSSLRKTAVWKWVRKLSEKVNVEPSRMHRRLIAMDETCVKVNGLEYWVYAALDVDRSEILSMGVYPSRNAPATEHFIREVLKYCDGKPKFTVDNAPWLKRALEELGLPYDAESFRR